VKAIKILVIAIVIAVVAVILSSYFIWLSYPKIKVNMYILDKTVKNFSYSKHRAIIWTLNNARIIKSNGNNYDVSEDYYGFVPLRPLSNQQYDIKRITLEQIDSFSNNYDALYYVDTYGIYFNEWFHGFRTGGENSVIDGGLNQNDYLLLKAMKEKKKLVFLQYNTLGLPTSELIKYKIEEQFGVHTSGWTGKYYSNLDSSNEEIPRSVLRLFKLENNKDWSFEGPGIIITNTNNVIVLKKDVHLFSEKPFISTKNIYTNKFHVPDVIDYPNTFEIVSSADTNVIEANFIINLTAKGDSLLHSYNLTGSFPAIVSYHRNGQNLYYFAGDFANIPVNTVFSRLANSRKFLKIFTTDDQRLFFLKFYFPFMESVLKDYSTHIK
jgi:hypothetical protein